MLASSSGQLLSNETGSNRRILPTENGDLARFQVVMKCRIQIVFSLKDESLCHHWW